MKTQKINIYYDAQEYYDELTLQAKIAAQEEVAQQKSPESAIAIIENLFPHADAPKALEIITQKMTTFKAIGHQYKLDIEQGGSRYKYVLLVAMAEILLELQEYEIILRYLYPHMNEFFNNLGIWYKDYTLNIHTLAQG